MQAPVATNLVAIFPSKLASSLFLTGLFLSLGILLGLCFIEDYRRNAGKNYQKISECNCYRKWKFPKENRPRIMSTCSDESTWFEPSQNVLTFSYFNAFNSTSHEGISQTTFFSAGAVENLEQMRKLYPGYTMRIYTNATLDPGNKFCDLLCSSPDVHWCDIRKVPEHGNLSSMYPMAWRFLPLGDPSVNVLLSRDLDSVVSAREVAAVNDWLDKAATRKPGVDTNNPVPLKGIHVMRDHVFHNYPILGGLWGASNKLLGKSHAKILQTLIVFWSKHPRIVKRKGFDQSVLSGVLFAKARDNVVAYDSYYCRDIRFRNQTEIRPFPIQRKNAHNDFVGNPSFGRGMYKLKPCPEVCRPDFGKDWKYC